MNIWDEKNSTEPKMNSNECTSSISKVITNETKNDSEKNVCENTGWIRKCPRCKSEIVYKRKTTYNTAVWKNTYCFKCKYSKMLPWTDKVLRRNCPVCRKSITHTTDYQRKIAEKLKTPCRKCSCIKRNNNIVWKKNLSLSKTGKNHPMFGKTNTDEYKENMSKRVSGKNNGFFGKHHKDSTKKILKARHIERKIKTGIAYSPSYNKIACKYFDTLNKIMGWNGRHALSGGEFFVVDTGYWVDYYEPNLNLVIEWDEPHHNKIKNREKDKIRQNYIIEKLKCSFYRIEQKTGKITKVAGSDFTLTNPPEYTIIITHQTMNKTKLLTFIEKYNLSGLVESVKLTTEKNVLKTAFVAEDKSMAGSVSLNDFKFDDGDIGIFETSKLKNFLKILEDEITLELVKVDDKPVALTASDKNLEVNFMLSDLSVIPTAPKVKEIKTFDVEIPIDADFVTRFVKAKNSLPDVDSFTLLMNKKGDKLELVVGFSSINSNRVKIEVAATKGKDKLDKPISFNANYLKEILSKNSDATGAILKIAAVGIAKLEFKTTDFESVYYLIQKQIES